ncbi:MAG: hypothetical protein NTY62_08280 [Euryarchaeota archaeon]|nr:hypothetical protein [Euryarchaeota archaeon]
MVKFLGPLSPFFMCSRSVRLVPSTQDALETIIPSSSVSAK